MAEYTIDQYTVLQLREFRGVKEIVEGRTDREGTWKPVFCKREFGKPGERVEKNVPVAVKIGTPDVAERTLLGMLYEITGKRYVKNETA